MNRSLRVVLAVFFVASCAAPALAQVRPRMPSSPATGETYRVEATFGWWNPTPELIIASESLGIPGTDIDFVSDLGAEKKRFGEFRVAFRPARKHKFRIQYIPFKYELDAVLRRDIVFNGQRYRVGLPVLGELDWKNWRFGYEYDFIYRDKGFVGFIFDVKYSDIDFSLTAPIGLNEFTHVQAPIPTVGGIGRVYVVPNVGLTLEITGLHLPESIDEDYKGDYFDIDAYGVVNFSDNFGAQVGYRRLNVEYVIDFDRGDLNFKGWYIAGVVRF